MAMLTRAGTAPPPHVLRFRFALWRRKVQLHVAIAWFKLLVREQGPLVQAAISRWRIVAAAAMRLHGAAIAWAHTAEARHTRKLWRRWQARHAQPHPVQCQLSGGWIVWSVRWQEAARQREVARRGLLHLAHRTLAAGLRSWKEMAAEQAAAAQLDQRGSSSSARRGLAAAVVRWRRGMLGAVAMWRGRAHMVRREQARGWQAWLSRQEEVGRWHARLRRGVAAGARGAARRALRVWAEPHRLRVASTERRRSVQDRRRSLQAPESGPLTPQP